MPCYYTYRYYTDTIEESQLMYLTGAASRIGAAVGNTTEGFRVNLLMVLLPLFRGRGILQRRVFLLGMKIP